MADTLSADDKAVLARWAGSSSYSDDESAVAVRVAALGSAELAALEILETKISDFLAEPTSQRVEGDVAWNTTKNIEALEQRAAKLAAAIDASGVTLSTAGAALVSARLPPGPISYTISAPRGQ